MEECENLLLLLSKVNVTNDVDKLIWKLKKNGAFSVKSYYEFLMGREVDRIAFRLSRSGKSELCPRSHFLLGRPVGIVY